ncbi:MAG: ribokinase [marine benthic group bacterium]|nr:ribokinase [Candidatus Benthicola marisminoris]
MTPRVVVVGSVNTDLVVRGPRIPVPGETVTGGTFLRADGGKGANQAVAAARLGANVTLVARVGADDLGTDSVAGLRSEGIDVRHVTADPEHSTGVALIMVDRAGENSILVAPGANAHLEVDDVEAARSAIESADVLLTQLESPLEAVQHAVEIARAAGVTVILNPAPARPLPESLLGGVHVLTPNRTEAALLSGESDPGAAADALRAMGCGTVVVTLGAEGALLASPDERALLPGFSVVAEDTTAAGDAFNGGLAVALAEGEDLAAAVRRACAGGALAATTAGARPSLPDRASIDRLLAEFG